MESASGLGTAIRCNYTDFKKLFKLKELCRLPLRQQDSTLVLGRAGQLILEGDIPC